MFAEVVGGEVEFDVDGVILVLRVWPGPPPGTILVGGVYWGGTVPFTLITGGIIDEGPASCDEGELFVVLGRPVCPVD